MNPVEKIAERRYIARWRLVPLKRKEEGEEKEKEVEEEGEEEKKKRRRTKRRRWKMFYKYCKKTIEPDRNLNPKKTFWENFGRIFENGSPRASPLPQRSPHGFPLRAYTSYSRLEFWINSEKTFWNKQSTAKDFFFFEKATKKTGRKAQKWNFQNVPGMWPEMFGSSIAGSKLKGIRN